MRLATILPRASVEPVPVAAAPDGTWIELAGLIGREAPRLKYALPWVLAHGENLPQRAAAWKGPRYRESEFSFLPPVVHPPAFRDFNAFVRSNRAPAFYFANHNALIGHDSEVFAPVGSHELDFELELGVLIGHGGHDIPIERAWEHVAGFTIINDLSARDLQRADMASGLGPTKGKDFATAVGPWLVLKGLFADVISEDHLRLEMTARVNGQEISRNNSSALQHTIPELIAQASRDAELFPGDLIGTGAPSSGSLLALDAANPPRWLMPGDVVELEIERLGVLRSRIAKRP
jgi:fumarylacetoacetate (FAA) hydrolase